MISSLTTFYWPLLSMVAIHCVINLGTFVFSFWHSACSWAPNTASATNNLYYNNIDSIMSSPCMNICVSGNQSEYILLDAWSNENNAWRYLYMAVWQWAINYIKVQKCHTKVNDELALMWRTHRCICMKQLK